MRSSLSSCDKTIYLQVASQADDYQPAVIIMERSRGWAAEVEDKSCEVIVRWIERFMGELG
jgi:hypothetical protein